MPGNGQSFWSEMKLGLVSVLSSHSSFKLLSETLQKKRYQKTTNVHKNVWEKVAVLLFVLALFYEQLFW